LATSLLLYKNKIYSKSPIIFESKIEAAESNWSFLYEKNFKMNSDIDNTIFYLSFEFNNLDYLYMIMH